MQALDQHPTVTRVRARARHASPPTTLSAQHLEDLARRCGADDVGLVEIGRAALDDQRAHVLQVFPATRTLLSFVVRMNREPVRSVVRSVANQEYHAVYDAVNETARAIVRALEEDGVPACNAVAAFPMEVQLPGRAWTVAHKPVAVAAGLGRMGVHRSVIHPVFGSFVLLGTVLVGVDVDAYDQPLDYDPCLGCNLCVSVCPVAALKPDGAFDFQTCYTHNYREFLGNFASWVDDVTDAHDATEYRRRVAEGETRSMWQSLSFKPGYKAAYCISVCPAGEDVIAPFLEDRKAFVDQVVRPLRDKEETLYVIAGSDAEVEAPLRFPRKRLKRVRPTMRATSAFSFLFQSVLGFQRGRARGVSLRYHLTFTGEHELRATMRIHDQKLTVEMNHVGDADTSIVVDEATWLALVNGDEPVDAALADGRLRVAGVDGSLAVLRRCLPGMLYA